MNFISKAVGSKLLIKLEGDLNWNVSNEIKDALSAIIDKEKKSLILDFELVKYISLNVCESLINVYKLMYSEKLDLTLIKVDETIKEILFKLGFQNVFYFAKDLSEAMLVKWEEKKDSQDLKSSEGQGQTEEKQMDSNITTISDPSYATGGRGQSGNVSEADCCEFWVKKSLFGRLNKKCGNCKFFVSLGNGRGSCSRYEK